MPMQKIKSYLHIMPKVLGKIDVEKIVPFAYPDIGKDYLIIAIARKEVN